MHYLSKEGEEVDGWMKLDERTLHHNCCCSHFQVEHTDSWAHGSNCSNWLRSWCPQCMHVASHESMCFVMSLIILIEQFHLQKKKPPPKKGFGFRVPHKERTKVSQVQTMAPYTAEWSWRHQGGTLYGGMALASLGQHLRE